MNPLSKRILAVRRVAVVAGAAKTLLLLATLLLPLAAHAQCVNLTTLGAASTQSFNTLSNTAGSTTNNLTLSGWFMTEAGGGARDNEQYAVDTGGSTTGDTYSYGAGGSTDRALGSLRSGTLIPLFGACFTNNTGASINALDVAYTGEQWRLGTAARTDQLDVQYSLNATDLVTGTWTNVDALDFVSPFTTTTGARDGNLAANRTALSASIASLSIANGATFWIRWNDADASGADDGLAIDDFALTPRATVAVNLSVNDVSLAEGNAGTTTFTFTVGLSAPAGPGGVTLDIATADNTAVAPGDYTGSSLTGQTIPAGASTYAFSVLVNGDTNVEANETFFVNVTNVTGATVTDGQGQGTINNDDVTLTPIHDIQGPGASSPIVGASVATRGVVTGVRSNGFFIQEPDATVDADPATSEGILVFTSGAPPAAAAVGNLVQVSGTVTEFVPVQDPLQPPMTELTSPTTLLVSVGNPLPSAVPLTSTFPDPAGPHDQLERLEGMRVSIASLHVVGPTLGNINEPNATATSTGVFFGVVAGNARPFREPGIEAPDPAPAGSVPPIPRWDANPELVRVDSDGLVGGTLLDVSTDATVGALVGPLDYTFRRYTLLPDPGSSPAVAGGATATAVTAPTNDELTLATYNLQRLFDAVDDPAIGEPVLTAAAYDNRLNKASIAMRQFLRMPDIIGVVEVENLAALQDLAARISADAIIASQPDPAYQAYLVEGNDIGGIDVGFLVKTAPVAGAIPRVSVNAVVQENDGEQFVNPDSSTEDLNDRPPLRLDAVVNFADRPSFPLTVVVNHLRSLVAADSLAPGSNGWATAGARIRAKRQAQADSLANLVQTRQTGNPAEHIVLLGDFNAFQFNDGLGHSIGTVAGLPPPDDETAVPGDGTDLVNPDLTVLAEVAAHQRYSYLEDGNAQSIDHVLVNAATLAAADAIRIEHARINADFPETARNTSIDAVRLSDHDPVVMYLGTVAEADVSLTLGDSPDPVLAGNNLAYTITATNAGPALASSATWNSTLASGTTFVSLTAPGGWTCTSPAVGAGGNVSCDHAAFTPGSAVFTLTTAVDAALASGTVLSQTASVASATSDPTPGNESATVTTTVATSADLSVLVGDAPDPVTAGQTITYTITAANAGPSNADAVQLSDTLPVGTTFVSLSSPGGWSCTTPAVGAAGTVTCTIASQAPASAVFTLVVATDASLVTGTVLSNSASATSTTSDPVPSNETATADTTVLGLPNLAVSMSDAPDPVPAGGLLTYTLTLDNNGSATADNVVLLDTLPAGTVYASLTAPLGWSCTTPPVGSGGTVSCTLAAFAPGSAVFVLTASVDIATGAGTVLTNSASAVTSSAESIAGDNTATATTTVGSSADLSVILSDAPDPVEPGTQLVYTITLDNAGPSLAENAAWSDTLPVGTRFVSLAAAAGWSCFTPAVGANGTVSCSQAMNAPGTTVFTLTVAVDADVASGTTLSNTVTLSSDTTDPDGGNDIATAGTSVVASADLSVLVSDAPDPVVPGAQLTYGIALANAGPSNADSATLDHTLPAGTTFASLTAPAGWSCTTPAVGAAGAIACTNPSMAPGNAAFALVLTVDPAATPGSTITGTVTTASAANDPTSDNSATTITTVDAASADLSVTLSDAPDPVTAGTQLTYTLGLDNAGPSHAADVLLADTLPTGTRFVSLTSPAGFACTTPAVGDSGAISCSNASMAVGAESFVLVVSVDADVASGTVLSDTATATSSTADPASGNETATTTTDVVAGVDLSVSLIDTPDPVAPGTELGYTITVDNAGPSNASDVTLAIVLPGGTGFVSLTTAPGWTCTTPAAGADGTIDCSQASLAPAASLAAASAGTAAGTSAFALVVSVPADVTTGTSLSATATVSSSSTDATPGNDSVTATTAVAAAAELSVAIADTPDPAAPGDNLQYAIDVGNAGPSDAADAQLLDTLPAGTSFVSLTAPAGWTCTTPAVGATGTIDCTTAAFEPGTVAFALVVAIDADATPGSTIQNTATISSSSADADAGNNSATATTTLGDGLADLSLTKVVSAPSVLVGGELVYTIVVDNAGPAFALDVVLTDPLPADTGFVALAAASGFDCTTPAVGTAGTISCSHDSLAPGNSTFTLTVAVDDDAAGGSVLSNTATVASGTPDSAAGDNSATATSTVSAPSAMNASKTVSGDAAPGSTLTYTIVLHNAGDAAQADNPGDEFVDVLPAGLTLVSASADSGSATADTGTGTVTWNGAIAVGGGVTIAIVATIDDDVADGTSIVNQGMVRFDADGDGTNEASAATDDPATAAAGDGTALVVEGGSVATPPAAPAVIPATSDRMALLLGILLALTAMLSLRAGLRHD